MCEMLIMNRDNSHVNPEKDKRGCYKRGDIVDVFPDGKLGPYAHANGTFLVLKIPGVSVDVAKDYALPEMTLVQVTALGKEIYAQTRRRRFKFDMARLLTNHFNEESENTYVLKGNVIKIMRRVLYDKVKKQYEGS